MTTINIILGQMLINVISSIFVDHHGVSFFHFIARSRWEIRSHHNRTLRRVMSDLLYSCNLRHQVCCNGNDLSVKVIVAVTLRHNTCYIHHSIGILVMMWVHYAWWWNYWVMTTVHLEQIAYHVGTLVLVWTTYLQRTHWVILRVSLTLFGIVLNFFVFLESLRISIRSWRQIITWCHIVWELSQWLLILCIISRS